MEDDDPSFLHFPAMPCTARSEAKLGHGNKIPLSPHSMFNAMVARPVGKREVEDSEEAKKARDKEWNRLRDRKVWDESPGTIMEWDKLAANARAKNKDINFGYLFGICVEKGSELDKTDPNRKYKYRVVFQGNRVVNQDWEAATFDDLGSSPATLEISRACDLYGCAPGHGIEMADAEQAYVQAQLVGTETWVCLPPEARIGSKWKGFRRPVVRLRLALYGHPDSGTCWERHCDAHLRKVGFEPVSEVWHSCYFHKQLRLFLVVYVDEFKLAGPKDNLGPGWSLIRKGLQMEDPTPLGTFLGCEHKREEFVMADGTKAIRMSYKMEQFMRSCVERYCQHAPGVRLSIVDTPFLPEDQVDSPAGRPICDGPCIECPWLRHSFAPSENT